MNTLSNALRAEVIRMARKELKPELKSLRETISQHRSEIAALRREVNSLSSQRSALRPDAATPQETKPAPLTGRRRETKQPFKPELVREMRSALGITQAQMALLLDASKLSISRWESGKASPRSAQLARINDLLSMGPQKAHKKLNKLEH